MTKRRVTATPTDDEIANFRAALTPALVEQMEQGASNNDRGIQRRITLCVLTKGASDLSRLSQQDAETYGEVLAAVEGFAAHAKALSETAQAALLRMKIADCREATTST